MVKEEIKYKETGIEWVPTIPSHWQMRRIKTLFTFRKEIVGEDSSQYKVLSLTVQGDGIIERDIESGMGKFPATFDGYQKIEPNSIVLCLFDMDVTPRIVGFSELTGMISAAYTNIVPKENVYPKFYYYYFLNQDRDKSLYALGKGIRITLREDSFGSLFAPYPSYEEQKSIVGYLDAQIEKINLFIQKKQRFIELLKEQKSAMVNKAITNGLNENATFKLSDIPFAEKFPIHYKIEKFNKYVFLRHGFQFRDYDFTEEGVKIVKITQLNPSGYLDLTKANTIDESRIKEFSDIVINEGDILMALTGGTIGKIIRADIKDEVLLQNYRVGNFIPLNSDELDKDYLYLQLSSPFIQKQINYHVRETGQPNIGKGDFRKIFLAIPPIEEQRQIVAHIKTETATIDTAIAKAEREIELIREYKEAMIAEAVMGKRK